MSAHPLLPIASYAPLAAVISVVGLLAAFAWIAWRFGPTLLRLGGWCSWWAAWACGSQGGYAYGGLFFLLGALSWSAGTIWSANRRGRWSSPLSRRLLSRVAGRSSPPPHAELATAALPRSKQRYPRPRA